jgi:hypothetical protein
MTELVIEKSILPELISSKISTEKVLMREENEVITLRPITDTSQRAGESCVLYYQKELCWFTTSATINRGSSGNIIAG